MDWRHPFGYDQGRPADSPALPEALAAAESAAPPAASIADAGPATDGAEVEQAVEVTVEPQPDPLAGWVRRQDAAGRWGWEASDLPEEARWWAVADFDELPEPGQPCPRCGSLEKWTDLLGGEHCGQCKARKLARAERLTVTENLLR